MKHEETHWKRIHPTVHFDSQLIKHLCGSSIKNFAKGIVVWFRLVFCGKLGKPFPKKLEAIFLLNMEKTSYVCKKQNIRKRIINCKYPVMFKNNKKFPFQIALNLETCWSITFLFSGCGTVAIFFGMLFFCSFFLFLTSFFNPASDVIR